MIWQLKACILALYGVASFIMGSMMERKKMDTSNLKLITPLEKMQSLQKDKTKKPKKKLKKDRSKLQVRKDNPNSGYHKKRADKAWGEYQHHFRRICLVNIAGVESSCNGPLNAHHLISRGNVFLRHEINNCAMLCAYHHNFSTTCSPHAGPIGFSEFLKEHYPHKYEWVIENQHKTGKPNYELAYETLTQWAK